MWTGDDPRISWPRLLSIVSVVAAAGLVEWLIFHNSVTAVMTVIIGVGLFASRRPSRWLYAVSGAAFVAALVIAPVNHTHRTNTVGSLLLAAGCAGLVTTFVARCLRQPEVYEDSDE